MKLLLGLLVAILPACAADVAGTWAVDGMIGNYHLQTSCAFTQKGHDLTGACSDKGATFPLKGSIDGKTVNWTYTVNFQDQHLVLKYTAALESASAMKGTLLVNENKGEFSAKRQ